MSTNTWERGSDLASPRWAVGVVATGSRLYALGGAQQMGNPAYDEVYYQELSTWPAVEWTEYQDPLPLAYGGMSTACTESVAGGEIWTTGGSYVDDQGKAYVLDTNLYHPSEACLGNNYTFTLAPDSLAGERIPGEVVNYSLEVANTGDTPDAYSVMVTSDWVAEVPEVIGALNPGESRVITVTVEVPAGTAPGDTDTATVQVTS